MLNWRTVLTALLALSGGVLVTAYEAEAAFPTVRSSIATEDSGGNTTSHTITMPATIEVGDLLLVFAAMDDQNFSSFEAGWTELENTDHGTYACSVYALDAAGTEDSTTITGTTAGSNVGSWIVVAIQDWGGTLGTDVEIEDTTTPVTGTSTSPDPPSLTASSGGTADRLWIEFIATHDGRLNVLSTFPQIDGSTAPDNQLSNNYDASSQGASTYVATDELTGVTQNPGTGTIAGSEDWCAYTLVVEPAAAGTNIAAIIRRLQ